jgi:non-homologous end joining protein Ku
MLYSMAREADQVAIANAVFHGNEQVSAYRHAQNGLLLRRRHLDDFLVE